MSELNCVLEDRQKKWEWIKESDRKRFGHFMQTWRMAFQWGEALR